MIQRVVLFSALIGIPQLLGCTVYDSDRLARAPLGFDDRDGDLPELDSGGPDLPDLPPGSGDATVNPGGPDAGGDAGSQDAGQDSGTLDAGDSQDAGDAGDTQDAGDAGDMQDAGDAGDMQDAGDAGDPQDAGEDAQVTDNCPGDPDKTEPGVCGCGIPDNASGCLGLIDNLAHRYRFEGSGTAIVDDQGNADGTANTSLSGNGTLPLAGGGSNDHATLPGSLISGFSAATVELWLTWQGGGQNQRPLSFGTAVPTSPSSNCPDSASYANGSWYEVCDQQTVWHTARGLCEDAGGHLLAIETAAEQQYLASLDLGFSVWIGANDIDSEGQWHFALPDGLSAGVHFWSGDSGGSAQPGAYANWADGQPTTASPPDYDDDCGFMYTSSEWGAFGCVSNGRFMCEWHGHKGSSMSRGVWFTPSDGSSRPRLSYEGGGGAAVAQGGSAFPTGVQTHVALVLDPGGSKVALYIDGVHAASVTATNPLSNLRDADNWLGRSHLSGDPSFDGTLHELRVYDQALTAEQIEHSASAGPDPAFLEQ